jgi:hypothetical protein
MGDAATNHAATWVATNLPAKKSTSASIDSALALASTAQCTYAKPLRTLVGRLEDQAKSFIKDSPAKAAKLAIAVDALGLNAKKFAGQNLVKAITKRLPANGDVGNYAFSQALAIIALARTGATVPDSMVSRLLEEQADNGSFGGYEYPVGTWNDDPDSTALAITALDAVADSPAEETALADALAWADDAQTEDGYWENYSPVDSTGLVGASVKLAGKDGLAAAARTWLLDQQLCDGGFPNELGGTESNLMSTSNALWLLSGTDLATVALDLGDCGKTPPKLPAATTSCDGVWVVVDRGNGEATTRCATKFDNGITALKSAGLKTKTVASAAGENVCLIQKFPSTCNPTSWSYWSYWYAEPQSDGSWGEWQSYRVLASNSTPTKGAAEGWLWLPDSLPYPSGLTPSVTPPKTYTAVPAVTIEGTPKVGEILTATVGTWAPDPADSSIQWYRSGKAIKGANRDTEYTLKKADKGKRITVRITASGGGYATVRITSEPTAKVTK